MAAELALKPEKAFGIEAGTTLRVLAVYDGAQVRKKTRSISQGIKPHSLVAA